MRKNDVAVFGTTFQQTHVWLNDIEEELDFEDKHKAFVALREVLHALRDRLPVEEAVHVGSQLPLLVAGIFYQGWNIQEKPFRNSHEAFIDQIHSSVIGDWEEKPEKVVRSVFKVISQHISAGKNRDIHSLLPQDLEDFWPEERSYSKAA